jgi:HAUS augmin-like complex subunit 1
MDSLSPSDLFSPSKARQQRAQAQDWAAVDSWLSSHYRGRAIPQFERNDDTLKALLALAVANETSAENQRVVDTVKKEAVQELKDAQSQREQHPLSSVLTNTLSELEANLTPDGDRALATLTTTATVLTSSDTRPETLAFDIQSLTTRIDELKLEIMVVQTLQSHLEAQKASLQKTLLTLGTDPALSTPSNLPQQTQSCIAQTKQLRLKLDEYMSRVYALTDYSGKNELIANEELMQLVALEQSVDWLAAEIRDMEGQLDAFKDLPSDLTSAKKEIQALEKEVEAVRAGRDELFAALAG